MIRPGIQEGWSTLHRLLKVADCRQRVCRAGQTQNRQNRPACDELRLAPLTTLGAVRTAGQLAHNEIELDLLRQKWAASGVTIDSVTFEFSNPNAPLSWHLTPDDVDAIAAEWNDPRMAPCRQQVKSFLAAAAGA
jgi:hypothetical protein